MLDQSDIPNTEKFTQLKEHISAVKEELKQQKKVYAEDSAFESLGEKPKWSRPGHKIERNEEAKKKGREKKIEKAIQEVIDEPVQIKEKENV